MSAPTYTCASCGETYPAPAPEDWSEEDRLAEEKRIHGRNHPVEERETVCDDCWRIMMLWAHTLPIEKRIEAGIRHLPPLEDLLDEIDDVDVTAANNMLKDII